MNMNTNSPANNGRRLDSIYRTILLEGFASRALGSRVCVGHPAHADNTSSSMIQALQGLQQALQDMLVQIHTGLISYQVSSRCKRG